MLLQTKKKSSSYQLGHLHITNCPSAFLWRISEVASLLLLVSMPCSLSCVHFQMQLGLKHYNQLKYFLVAVTKNYPNVFMIHDLWLKAKSCPGGSRPIKRFL